MSEDDNADDSRNVDAEYDKTIEEYLNLPKCNQCNQICNSNVSNKYPNAPCCDIFICYKLVFTEAQLK